MSVGREPTETAVSVEQLGRRFGPVVAVQTLSFTVRRGEVFGMVGPDGAGKTTTLRMLAGILPPSAGGASVAGVDVVKRPEDAKHRLGYMAQRFGLYEDLTVGENLDFYADLYRVPREERPARYERLYRFSRLGEFASRLAGNLSGGMKQKLSLSCCLVHEPDVLLLDEPTFGVDPISRQELWTILEEMVADGTTIVVSTSYLDEAERCDRVALLNEGRALVIDRPDAIRSSIEGIMVSLRVTAPREARDVLRRTPGVQSASIFEDSVHALIDRSKDPEDVRGALRHAGLEILESQEIQPSLEDAFIHLVSTQHA